MQLLNKTPNPSHIATMGAIAGVVTVAFISAIVAVMIVGANTQTPTHNCNCVNGTNGINGTDGATGTFSGIIADSNFTLYDGDGSNTTIAMFDVTGGVNTGTTIVTNSSLGNVTFTLQPNSGTAIIQNTLGFTFGNPAEQSASDQNSAAIFQIATTKAGGATLRSGQHGNSTGVPGISGYKSRGIDIHTRGGLIPGDTLVRMTGTGVAPNNIDAPIGGFISIDMAGYTQTAQNNTFPTQIVFQTVSVTGGINTHRTIVIFNSEGLILLSEHSNAMAGVATTGVGGSVVVSNTNIVASTRVQYSIQDGGTTPTGGVYLSAKTTGSMTFTSFTGDVNVTIYWQLYGQVP